MAQGHAGNRGTGLGALLDDLGLEGFGIGTALAWHGRSSARGLKWCPPKTGGHHAATWRNRGGVLPGRLLWSRIKLGVVSGYGPGNSRQFIGQSARHHIGVASLEQGPNPFGQRSFLRLQPLHISPGALNQQTSEALVAALADPLQVGPAASAVLLGYQADGGGEVSTAAELFAITHFDSQQAGGDRADAGHAQQTTA
ncbi:hypothetical protein D9M70_442710 [compost metagenome]